MEFRTKFNLKYLIEHNVKRLCDGGEIEAEIFRPPLNFNRNTND